MKQYPYKVVSKTGIVIFIQQKNNASLVDKVFDMVAGWDTQRILTFQQNAL